MSCNVPFSSGLMTPILPMYSPLSSLCNNCHPIIVYSNNWKVMSSNNSVFLSLTSNKDLHTHRSLYLGSQTSQSRIVALSPSWKCTYYYIYRTVSALYQVSPCVTALLTDHLLCCWHIWHETMSLGNVFNTLNLK